MAIQGMGGSGKSQLAAEYAHHSKISDKPYRLIRWLKADSKDNLKNAYFALGDDLGVERKDYKDNETALIKAIHRQLLRYERVLLIYDNVESLDYLSDYQPSAGGNSSIHALITTRNRFVDYPTLEVKEFTGQEIQSYLSQRLKKEIPLELANQLGQELGYLPLAIVQSAAYMMKYAKSVEAFLKLLQTESRQKVLESSDAKLKTVATLWNMTLEKLSPQALEVIRLCAYLDPDNIPQSLLEKMIGENEDEVLFELRSQSLLIETGGMDECFRIHRLLQEAVRRQLLSQDKTEVLAKAIVEKGIASLKIVIGDTREQTRSERYLFWKKRDFIILQVDRLIKEGEKLKVNEGLLANLFDWAGDYQRVITLNDKDSLALYQRSFAMRKALYGDNHPDLADSLMNIGIVYDTQGRKEEALPYYQQSLNIRKATYGDNHPLVALSLSRIGSIYYNQSFNEKALKCHQESLAIRKAVYGDHHLMIAWSIESIGLVYKDLGQYEKALACYEQALAIDKVTHGENHPDVAITKGAIADVYNAQGQYDRALEIYRQALAMRKAIYGEQHPDVAMR